MRNGMERWEIDSGSRHKKKQWQTFVMSDNIQVPLQYKNMRYTSTYWHISNSYIIIYDNAFYILIRSTTKLTKLRGFSPQANYTD
jgi:hypothetical protein